jgi:hypothetical protein
MDGYGDATSFRECVLWRSEAEVWSRHLEDIHSRLGELNRRLPAECYSISATDNCPPTPRCCLMRRRHDHRSR